MGTDTKIKRRCFDFARRECAHNYDGWCVPQDCPCFVYAPLGWVCTYFLNAVLPMNPPLLAAVQEKLDGVPQMKKKCVVCGDLFVPKCNRQMYCPDCAETSKRKDDAKRARDYRARKNTH